MDDSTLPSNRPKSRQSLAHIPISDTTTVDHENVTADVSSMQRSKSTAPKVDKKKLRSKSLGPGGLEALKETAGNAVKVCAEAYLTSHNTLTSIQLSQSFTPKSILKPSIPLTPPKVIPTFDETRKRGSTLKSMGKSPSKNTAEDLLIDFSTPAPTKTNSADAVPMVGAETVLDPFSPITRSKSPRGKAVAVRTEEEQKAAAREREAEERRKSDKQAILEQRAARRKSMANRRVSFAPEATLHTWNVIEMAEDSTTSSASNSTRRQSSMTGSRSPLKNARSPGPDTEVPDAPSTPPEQSEEPLVKASPAHQRDVHQKKRRRRSSTNPAAEPLDADDEVFSSSPFMNSSVVGDESSPARVEESIHSDESDTEGDTAMSVDEGTGQTATSDGSTSSTQSSLDERLRRAATVAGTRGIEYDENGEDLSMELATGTVTNAFQPWAQKAGQQPHEDLSAMQDQENVNPFSPVFKARAISNEGAQAEYEEETQDMSMDVTTAVGGNVGKRSSPGKARRKSVAPPRRRSSVARRRSSGGESAMEEETMDLTTVDGGIIQPPSEGDNTKVSDEDMSMEFTNVIGGVLQGQASSRRDSISSNMIDDNEAMDMTMAVGGILPPIEEQTEPQTDVEDQTAGMDFTVAAGAILRPQSNATTRTRAKEIMEAESDVGQLALPLNLSRDLQAQPTSPQQQPGAIPIHVTTSVASETGSPSFVLKPRLSGRGSAHKSTTPRAISRQGTPVKTAPSAQNRTPTKQITPLPGRSGTPNKTPIMANVTHRGASPKKLFKAEIKARASPGTAQKSNTKQRSLFEHDEHTGQQTPSVVLHPHKPHQHLRRRSSGIGMDHEGLGSPRVAELLDRRTSIGECANAFVPQPQGARQLRFDDPRAMEEEIDAEREEDERRESGRFVMEQEADRPEGQEENATLQLKEMIDSMTPRKNKPSKLKGRKSLHVGTAKGILGKRPAELDLDDDDEDAETTPKRLKKVSREASPVKQVHLPKPPTKDETTGRLTRAKRRSLDEAGGHETITPTLSQSPSKASAANTPQAKGRYVDVAGGPASSRPTSFEDKLDNVLDAVDVNTEHGQVDQLDSPEHERISLQEFLNMTNIHFIELSATKRRHTTAQAAESRPSQEGSASLESCFAAAATTLPMLELYQHATRELKSYISSGRKIIRSIEAETLQEQPALFREYVEARPDVKMVMDNQFRNGKTNARLQSKEGWYAWRSQLVDGLRGGLEGIKQGMETDGERLAEQETLMEQIVPGLVERYEHLEREAQMLKQRADEINNVDQESIRQARAELSKIDTSVNEHEILLEQLQQQIRDKDDALTAAAELKEEFQAQIDEAERVQEESRGWSSKDVLALNQNVDAIERESGWKLVTAEEDTDEPNDFGVAVTMRYKDTLRLFFHPTSFQPKQIGRRRSGRKSKSDTGTSAPISLTHQPTDRDLPSDSSSLPTEQRFFLQLLQSQLHAFTAMPKGTVSARTLCSTVANGWQTARKVTEEIRQLNLVGITSVSILGDEKLAVKIMLMLRGNGRLDVDFSLHVSITPEGEISTASSVTAKPIYGQIAEFLGGAKATKVRTALNREVESKELGTGALVGAIRGFELWLVNQQQKSVVNKPEERKPLSPKKNTNAQKKALPVPVQQKRVEVPAAPEPSKMQQQVQPMEPVAEKENVQPMEFEEDLAAKTPGRRIGALRRSPIVG